MGIEDYIEKRFTANIKGKQSFFYGNVEQKEQKGIQTELSNVGRKTAVSRHTDTAISEQLDKIIPPNRWTKICSIN